MEGLVCGDRQDWKAQIPFSYCNNSLTSYCRQEEMTWQEEPTLQLELDGEWRDISADSRSTAATVPKTLTVAANCDRGVYQARASILHMNYLIIIE